MHKRPVGEYVTLGQMERFLTDCNPGQDVHGSGWVLDNLEGLHALLPEYGFVVSARAAADVLSDVLADLQASPPDAKLTVAQAQALNESMLKFRTTLTAEAGGMVAYIATDKRYPVQSLLENMAALFPPGGFDELPEITRHDLAEAGKAIAYELPTAAAFHLLRATEEALRVFYRSWVRSKRIKVENWGAMTSDMRKRRTKPPEALLNHLDHIRQNFRNPTDHPEKIYDIEEVQDLLGLCCDAIRRLTPRITSSDRARLAKTEA
jgi:hypothetical protein